MSLENNQQVKSDDNQEHSAKVDNSRRSFAKRSAAIAPVIMTLANRSAWGGTNVCSNSGWNSFHEAGNRIASHEAIVKNTNWQSYDNWQSTPTTSWPSPHTGITSPTAISVILSKYPASVYADTVALAVDVLASGGINAYRIATVLNEQQSSGIPLFLFSALAIEDDFIAFYKECL